MNPISRHASAFLLAAAGVLAGPIAPTGAQTQPQCTVNEGASFYRQKEFGKAYSCGTR
jgi:hypothetical protein